MKTVDIKHEIRALEAPEPDAARLKAALRLCRREYQARRRLRVQRMQRLQRVRRLEAGAHAGAARQEAFLKIRSQDRFLYSSFSFS